MKTVKYLISDRQLEDLEHAAKYKGISLNEALSELTAPYLEHYKRIKKNHEQGSDPKIVKRLHKKEKAAYKQEMSDKKRDYAKNPRSVIPISEP